MTIFDETQLSSEQPPVNTQPCPECHEELVVYKVKKENRNHGREFITCEECNVFEWLDMPNCRTCHRRLFEAQAKKDGRWFRACPSGCKGAFKWLAKEPE